MPETEKNSQKGDPAAVPEGEEAKKVLTTKDAFALSEGSKISSATIYEWVKNRRITRPPEAYKIALQQEAEVVLKGKGEGAIRGIAFYSPTKECSVFLAIDEHGVAAQEWEEQKVSRTVTRGRARATPRLIEGIRPRITTPHPKLEAALAASAVLTFALVLYAFREKYGGLFVSPSPAHSASAATAAVSSEISPMTSATAFVASGTTAITTSSTPAIAPVVSAAKPEVLPPLPELVQMSQELLEEVRSVKLDPHDHKPDIAILSMLLKKAQKFDASQATAFAKLLLEDSKDNRIMDLLNSYKITPLGSQMKKSRTVVEMSVLNGEDREEAVKKQAILDMMVLRTLPAEEGLKVLIGYLQQTEILWEIYVKTLAFQGHWSSS